MADLHVSTPPLSPTKRWDRLDYLIAFIIALVGLGVYTSVLAPDILYGDSGEFQTLAYTWSITHTTGYPVYLVYARIIGLIPVGTLAWRINFASAVAAALTMGGVYLIARYFVRSRAVMVGSAVLLLSYTFWSQAIIAEVYTTAAMLIVAILLTLLIWRDKPARRWLVFLAGFLLTVGLGVHLFLMLIAPAVFLFVLWGILVGSPEERWHWKHLFILISGTVAGALTFFLLFAYMDTRPTPTNIFTTAIYPSRDEWGLTDTDLDSVPERFWISVSGYQWRGRMLPKDANYQDTIDSFLHDDLPREFATATLLLAVVGGLAALIGQRRLLALVGAGLLVTFAAGLVYFPPDKYIFYLPFYVLLAIMAGVGAGYLTDWISRLIPAGLLCGWARHLATIALTLILVGVCATPFANVRLKAIQLGKSTFISEDYVYPVNRLGDPRRAAECALSKVPEADALLVLDWRALYSIYYVAHVEQGRTGIVIHEAQPYPAQKITPNLLAELRERVAKGEAVYVDNPYEPLRDTFTFTRAAGSCTNYNLAKLSLRE